MKQTLKKIGYTGALLTGALLTQTTASAQTGVANILQHTIVGLWDVSVSVTNCSGTPLPVSFPGLHKFELGGTGQVVPGTNPAATSAHMMVWKSLGRREYQWTAKFFRFANGTLSGYTILESVVSISKDGTSYEGAGVSTNYDTNGDPIGTPVCPEFIGTRFTGDL